MTDSRRLFFAVWPDAAAAKALHAAARDTQTRCGGRLMLRETLHLTLAFLGELGPECVAEVTAAAAGMAFAPFELTLDRLNYWKHNRIAWAGGDCTPLTSLAEELGRRLRAAGFRIEARPFVAHMTLLRDARCAEVPALTAPASWPVREFTLVESQPTPAGSRYEVIGRWSANA